LYLSITNSVKELEQELNTLRGEHESLKKQHQLQQSVASGSTVAAATKARQFSGKLTDQFCTYLIACCNYDLTFFDFYLFLILQFVT